MSRHAQIALLILLLAPVSGRAEGDGPSETPAATRSESDASPAEAVAADAASAAARDAAGSDAASTDVRDADEPGAANADGPDVAKSAGPGAGPADAAAGAGKQGPKEISGMSVLGNREAPKSLVIVPWKSSELGGSVGITALLDDSREPVDREVFMRALTYYEVRSESDSR